MAAPVQVIVTPGPPPSLDLHGPLTPRVLEAALAVLPPCTPTLKRHTATHHTLQLPPPPYPAGTLADLLAVPQPEGATPVPATAPAARAAGGGHGASGRRGPAGGPGDPGGSGDPCAPGAYGDAGACGADDGRAPGAGATAPARSGAAPVRGPLADPRHGTGRQRVEPALPAAPLQRDVLLDALARPGAGLHVGQVHWRWHGPLDTDRFTAAWESVAGREAVLRACLARPERDAGPQITVRSHAVPEIRRHRAGTADWYALLAAERVRPFDLRHPGPLRIALLDEPPTGDGTPSTRILVTYHQALLDRRSVRILLGAFQRAYLADGRAPGGQRRPDVRDHLQWVRRQDLGPARAFWTQAAPVPGVATLPAHPAGRTTGRLGHGRTRQTLTPFEATRLRDWAAERGATESTALHAAWALQLYRPAVGPVPGPRSVAFAVSVSGRGIPLQGVEALPAPLRNPLPVHLVVDPATTVPGLLAELTGQALDAAAYEWVSTGQIRAWAGASRREDPLTETLLVFEPPASAATGRAGRAGHGEGAHREELAAEGIRMGSAEAVDPITGVPFTLTARHEPDGSLVLSSVYDRTRFSDEAAELVLAQTATLLRELPAAVGPSTTVAEALNLLSGARVPLATAVRPAVLQPLGEAAHPGAGTVCLIPPPGAPEDCYARAARLYPGPEALATLTGPADAADFLTALRPALATGEPLVLGGFSGAGALACEIAERIAAHGWYPPLVVIAGTADGGPDSARSLTRALTTAAARTG
ncbi:condensation domain-containing protein [Streptomyces sp. NPDC059650]|uniref:condensation domain-containing protein n=1 Tax=Streptomyces sp. NPDC059650 TaxID=3346896 RepID=UPI0036822D64